MRPQHGCHAAVFFLREFDGFAHFFLVHLFSGNAESQFDKLVNLWVFLRLFCFGLDDEAIERDAHFGQKRSHIHTRAAGQCREQQGFRAGAGVVAERRFVVNTYDVVVHFAVEGEFGYPGGGDVVGGHGGLLLFDDRKQQDFAECWKSAKFATKFFNYAHHAGSQQR